jgi:hypothetical protein
MAVTKPSVTRPDMAKCAKQMNSAVKMVAPALRRALCVTSKRIVLMDLMRNIVVS